MAEADAAHQQAGATRGGTPARLVGAGIVLLVAVLVYFAVAMPGMDHSTPDAESTPADAEHDMADMGDE